MLVLLHKRRLVNTNEFLDLVKASIKPEEIEKFLPFGVIRKDGDEFQHLILNSVIPVTTDRRTVIDGEALCQRFDTDYTKPTGKKEMCRGCFEIAKGVAVRSLELE